MIRTHLLKGLALVMAVAGCSGGRGAPDPAHVQKATVALAALTDARIAAALNAAPARDLTVGFQPQIAVASCGDETVRVSYDPYQNGLAVGFSHRGDLAEELRSIAVDGKPKWSKLKPSKDLGMTITDGEEHSEAQRAENMTRVLYDLTTKHTDAFPPDGDVNVVVTGKGEAQHPLGDRKYEVVAREHGPWRVKLHVFGADAVAKLKAYNGQAVRGAVIKNLLDGYANDAKAYRNEGSDPTIAEFLARYDALRARQDQAGPSPFATYAKALVVEQSPCPAAR